MKRKTVALFILTVLLYLPILCVAQDIKIISRFPNMNRIIRAWNSIAPATVRWNEAMKLADESLHANRPDLVNDATVTRQRVAYYKIAREALLDELHALDELIDEEGIDE